MRLVATTCALVLGLLIASAKAYFDTQDAHHRRMDFGAELIALLKKHGVEYDPRFVFG